MNDDYKLCFVIACKYVRGYESYLPYYIANINNFYPNSLIVLVDNNSHYFEDIKVKLQKYDNIIYLVNNITCKYEQGAYHVGARYLLDNNITDYDYIIFSQDTYVLKNKYDFNILINENITAAAFHAGLDIDAVKQEMYYIEPVQSVLRSLNLQHSIDKLAMCMWNSFVLHQSKLAEYYSLIRNIVTLTKHESGCTERYMSPILYHLNNNRIYQLDAIYPPYNIFTDNPFIIDVPLCFVKRIQFKDEFTVDKIM